MVQKGHRVELLYFARRNGVGPPVCGVVFWVGADEFDGERTRLGVRCDDGETRWVYDEDVKDLGPNPPPPPPSAPLVHKGDRVTWRDGRETGEGVVFWVGASKHGPGIRVGVSCGGAKRFVASEQVAKLEPWVLYGADPASWNQPRGLVERSVDICFVREPKAPELEAIAERTFADLRVGRSVLRCCEYLWLPLEAATNEAALAAAQGWLDELDGIVPIRDAVFLAACPSRFGAQVEAKRPRWQGFLVSGGAHEARVIDEVIEDTRARLSGARSA